MGNPDFLMQVASLGAAYNAQDGLRWAWDTLAVVASSYV